MICCMTCPWVSYLESPVSSPVSSPSDSVAIRRFSSRPHHRFNMADVDVYGPSSAYVIRPVGAASSPTVATVSSPVVPLRHRPAGLCRHRPAGLCRHRRRFSSAYHLFEAFNIRHFGCYVQ